MATGVSCCSAVLYVIHVLAINATERHYCSFEELYKQRIDTYILHSAKIKTPVSAQPLPR